MPLSRFYRWRRAFIVLISFGALWETCIFALFLFIVAGAADYLLVFSSQARACILFSIVLLIGLFFIAELIRAWKKSRQCETSVEQFLGLKRGELTAALEFQQKIIGNTAGAGLNGSEELAQAAISNVDQSLQSGKMSRWAIQQSDACRWMAELAVSLLIFIILFATCRSECCVAAKRLTAPTCTDVYAPVIPEPQPPTLESVSIRAIPPASTMKGSFDVPTDSDSAVPIDSTVRFFVTFRGMTSDYKPVVQIVNSSDKDLSTLELNPEQTAENISKAKADVRWSNSAQYRIVVEPALSDATASPSPAPCFETQWRTINVTPDQSPQTELKACQAPDLEVVADALIPLEIHSEDDYGIVSTSLRWRILKPEEVKTGIKPAKIVYQRQPVWDAFQDETISRPPKMRVDKTSLNLSTMELQPEVELDVMGQSVDTRMTESDSSLLRLKVVTAQQINEILVGDRIRIGAELRRTLETLDKVQKETKPEIANGLYDEFSRQTWGANNGIRTQLLALVERVKMNHVPWGRTLVDLESAGRKLDKLHRGNNNEIVRLFAILNLDDSDKEIKGELNQQLQKLSDEIRQIADSFGQWSQYRELCESFKPIRQTVLSIEKQVREGITPEFGADIPGLVSQTASQTQSWIFAALQSAIAYKQADASQHPQAVKWSAALQETVKVLDSPTLQTLYAQAGSMKNSVAFTAAVVQLREIYDKAWALLSASGDDAAQKRLELKATMEYVYDQQITLNKRTKSLKDDDAQDESALRTQLANSQQELAQAVESINAPNMTVVTDALLQTRDYMVQAADFIQQGQKKDNIIVCQNAATERLEQILETLNDVEQLAILALNKANESEEADNSAGDKSSDDAAQSKVSVEDLKLLELSQRRLLAKTQQAYADALDAGSMQISEQSAAILADEQQRLASLTWFLTSITVSPELLRGEQPKKAEEPADSLDDALLGDLTEDPEPTLTDAQKAELEQKKKEQEFLDSVWNELGTAAVSEEDAPLLEIVRMMRQTYELFKMRDAGEINQGLQEQICNHFISFINQLSFSRSKKSTSETENQGVQKENENSKETNPENAADDQQTVDASAPGDGEKTSDGASQPISDEQLDKLKRRIWGELPDETQKAVPTDSEPIQLPTYRSKIEKYWESLDK